ncbi:hypothetical protein SALBM135S_07220 [Streptomyces alboniger]
MGLAQARPTTTGDSNTGVEGKQMQNGEETGLVIPSAIPRAATAST